MEAVELLTARPLLVSPRAVSVVLVTGGSGTLGRPLVSCLSGRGDEVRVLSCRYGVGSHLGDLSTGIGLAAATAGVDLVVHAASDTRRLGRTDVEQTRHLLAALEGVKHLVYVSIVGIDAIPMGYYRRKLACEDVIERAGIPHPPVRATQFHELVASVLGVVERLPAAPLLLDFRFQPVAAAEVATRVAELLRGTPVGRAPDVGGPEVLTLGDMARIWRSRRGRPRALWRVWVPGSVGRAFRQGHNTCPDHKVGRQRWEEFIGAYPPRTRPVVRGRP